MKSRVRVALARVQKDACMRMQAAWAVPSQLLRVKSEKPLCMATRIASLVGDAMLVHGHCVKGCMKH